MSLGQFSQYRPSLNDGEVRSLCMMYILGNSGSDESESACCTEEEGNMEEEAEEGSGSSDDVALGQQLTVGRKQTHDYSCSQCLGMHVRITCTGS